ncbi:MAG: hypothetical protein E5W91_32425 [Mesorhizobium sp.]|uniref:hypothetical protein n=1 Tax=Mesorhizobium sp. TaxID=1871066 RepID=UPI0012168D49|nr:hypothetical protein [Mesorhizobium sp.]TIS53095.1 MAG: hypothetical protein E5W91_32425 [Mesorhizobium sp.]
MPEVYEFQAKLDSLAEQCGGWRNMPDEAFNKLVGMYTDKSSGAIVGKAFADHEAFQAELERRVVQYVEWRTNPPKQSGIFGRLFGKR